MAKKTYTILRGSFSEIVNKQRVTRVPGDTIKMDEAEAKPFVDSGELIEGEKKPKAAAKGPSQAEAAKLKAGLDAAVKRAEDAESDLQSETDRADQAEREIEEVLDRAETAESALSDAEARANGFEAQSIQYQQVIERLRADHPDAVTAAEEAVQAEIEAAGNQE